MIDLKLLTTRVIKNANRAKPGVLEARPYQERIVTRTTDSYHNKGMRSVLIESATGSGKTTMALLGVKALQKLYPDLNVGWFAMRRNLLAQAEKENNEKGIKADIQFLSMFDRNPPNNLDMIVVDEAQHDAANSMVHIHNINRPRFILGMTATPFRTDSVKLCFDTVIKDAGIGRLIKDGYLSQYDHYTVPKWSPIEIAQLYLNNRDRFGKSIFYFHTLDQCRAALDVLEKGGVGVEFVTGDSDREEQLARFEEDKSQVIVNCMVLTEGFDCPSLKTAFLRPSCKSVTIQMGGRVFRKYPGLPIKQLVQCTKTRWPFLKTALPKMQYLLRDDGTWASMQLNENINKVSVSVVAKLATIKTHMPDFITKNKQIRKKRVTGFDVD